MAGSFAKQSVFKCCSVHARPFDQFRQPRKRCIRSTFADIKHSTSTAPLRQTATALPHAYQPYSSRQLSWQCGWHRNCGGHHRYRRVQVSVGDAPPEWTLDQIAGLVFGGFLLVTIALALQVDKVVAKAQRRELGLCEHCGGMNDPALCKAGKCPAIQR